MIKKGCIVKSTAGRDAQRFFVVMDVDGDFAVLADGKVRPLERPKRKKLKHLQKTNRCVDLNEMISNNKLRHTLSPWNNDRNNGEVVT